MKTKDTTIKPCCKDAPVFDTWIKNESRSIYCIHCGKHIQSYFLRQFAYAGWKEINKGD